MSGIIQAALVKSQRSEYGQVTVSFPIPNDQYDQIIESLHELEMGFSINRDCKIGKIDSKYPALAVLKDSMVNIDQLDYLAKRLSSFSPDETNQFEAMAYRMKLAHVKDFINLTFCCQQATVITDFSDLEKIGRDHCMDISGGAMSMEEYQKIDDEPLP